MLKGQHIKENQYDYDKWNVTWETKIAIEKKKEFSKIFNRKEKTVSQKKLTE